MAEYIEREAMIKRLKCSPLFLGHLLLLKDGVVDLVKRQPAADVVEVRRGKWVADDKFDNGKSSIFHCSECCYSRATSVLYTAEKLAVDDPYCKKCGAKMDGKGENDG